MLTFEDLKKVDCEFKDIGSCYNYKHNFNWEMVDTWANRDDENEDLNIRKELYRAPYKNGYVYCETIYQAKNGWWIPFDMYIVNWGTKFFKIFDD